MTELIIFMHVVICILLIAIILMQPGKAGGLTDSMASAESIFGAKTNVFIIKTTAIFAVIFLVTCLGLAILSSQKGKSLMTERALPPVSTQKPAQSLPGSTLVQEPVTQTQPVTQPEPVTQAPAVESAPVSEPAPEAAAPATQQ